MWPMVLTLVYKAWEGHKLMYEYVLLFTALVGLLARISSQGRLITLFSAFHHLEHVMRDRISDSVNILAPPTRTLTLQASPHQWASDYADAPPTQGYGYT